MGELSGSVVVITGAGSGIGRATALAFAREGARLHLVDIDGDGAGRAPDRARDAGAWARAHTVDCSDAGAMLGLAASVHDESGRVDVLHLNAGVCIGGPVEEITLDDWRWITGVNYWGVVHGVHAFVPRMIEQGGGHIVCTSSMAGLVGLPFVVPYCATKFAVVGLAEALSAELARHDIHVSVVCPGFVRTDVVRNARMRLPGAWNEKVERAFERWAADPDVVARKVVRAVRSRRSFVLAGREMLPLYMIRTASVGLYQRLARFLTRRALSRA
jgi:NAD(P)-dependent dehydrogenase (short-subunit alcohol dehydrogenase family)